jgi:thiol-disulfide isomerase/thioredoxin
METKPLTTTEKATEALIEEALANAMAYDKYRQMVAQLVSEGKSTGPEQTEALSNYTVLNDRRMQRFDKTVKLDDDTVTKIKSIDKKIAMLVLTESWCGDAAPTMPVMNKIAELNENIDFKVILRDENLKLMNRFLTDAALSIPKLIFLDDENRPFGSWGPRPEPAAQMVRAHKKEHGRLLPEIREELQRWYNQDKGRTTLEELMGFLPVEQN